jgi:hypothetical protein
MSKFYNLSEDTIQTFKTVFKKKSFPFNIGFQFIGSESQKNLIKINKISDQFSFILEKYNVDIFNCSTEDKNKVRHELVNHARTMRQNTKGRYWIEKLQSEIEAYKKSENFKQSDIFCVTDIRHFEYPSDEVVWLKEENKGFLIYVEKFFEDGSVCAPANDDERRNDPFLRKNADHSLCWRHGWPEKYLKDLVKKTLDISIKEGKLYTHDRLN